jgi:MFS family permease
VPVITTGFGPGDGGRFIVQVTLQKLKGSRLWTFDRQIWMLFLAEIINVFGTSIIRTFLAIYMYEEMHIPLAGVGVALFVSSLTGAAAAYAGGSIADAHGRKKVLVTGLALQIVAYVLISLSIDASVPYVIFLGVLALSSLIQGFYQSVPDVMVADVVEPGRRVEAYGILRVGANLGWVIGPVVGGLLLVVMPFSWVFYLAAATTFGYLLIASFELRETKATRQSEKLHASDVLYILKDRPFIGYVALTALMLIPYQQMYTLLSVYSSDVVRLGDFWIGILFAMSGVMVVVFQFPISLRVKNHRLTTMLALSTLVFAAGFSLLGLSTAFAVPFLCMAVATTAEMIWAPAGSTMQANLAPEDRRGRYFGFAGLLTSLGIAFGPLTGGVLLDTLNNDTPLMWGIVAAMFLACGAGFLLLNRLVPEAANAPQGKLKVLEKKLEAPLKA